MIYLFYKIDVLGHIIDIISYTLNYHNITHKIVTYLDGITDTDLVIGLWNSNTPINVPKNIISLNVEPLRKDNWALSILDILKKSKFIIDYSSSHKSIFKTLDITNYCILNYGYCDLHEKIYADSIGNNFSRENSKTIDLLFYGFLTKRRLDILNKLIIWCNNKKYNIVIRNDNLYDYKEKSELVARSKIVLSLAHDDPQKYRTNDMLRLSFLISNKAFVLAEQMGDKDIENKLCNYITYYNGYEDLVTKIEYYLKNNDQMITIADECYNYCKKNMNILNTFPIDKIMEFI